MLATMLVRSLCRTFRSPNQRISQGWEGKEPASAGFLLAVVLVCYAQDKINKSYQLDTTMKINEIASRRLDEAPPPGVKPVVKYVGPYFDKAAAAAAKLFGAGKGTTPAEFDALRAGETGAAKAAKAAGSGGRPPSGDRPLSTVSKDELNALLYPPRAAPAPTVGSFLKKRGDLGFDPNLSKNQALPGFLQNMPPARIGPVIKPSPSGPRPRNATPELGNMEPPLQASPAAAEIGQIRPGVETPTPAASPTAADAQRYTMDEIRQFQELLSTNPAAAQEQAKKMGWLGKAGWTTAGAAALGLGVQGAHMAFPDKVPSVGQMTSKAAGAVSDTITPIGVDPDGSGPPKGQPAWDPKANEPSSNREEKQSSDKKSSDADPLRKEKDEELRKALAGEIEESASEFNRIVYLSRL